MDQQYASFGQRALAYIIDGFIVLFLSVPFYFLLNDSRYSFNQVTLLPRLVIGLMYNTYLLSRNGATVGKRLAGIRVVSADGSPLSGKQAFLREFLGKSVMGMFVIGFFWMLFDAKKQCWQDKIAGTLVVRT